MVEPDTDRSAAHRRERAQVDIARARRFASRVVR